MPSTQTSVSPDFVKIPGVDLTNLYVLHYRQGVNPHPMQKNFHCSGGLKAAIDRARKYCETTNNRFINVRPFVSDLDREERNYVADFEE